MRIGVFGAGSIGCYVGGRLVQAGADVVFLGRASLAADLVINGLALSDCDGFRARFEGSQLRVVTDVAELADRELVLVSVKSRDTAQAGQALRKVLRPETLVVSLQNGVHNADDLRRELPGWTVLGGMVPFNVLRLPDGTFHRGTTGALQVGPRPGASAEAFASAVQVASLLTKAGVTAQAAADIVAVQWGKLLFNLNNALNALSGRPLRAQLAERGYRRILAAAMAEGLTALRAAGVRPAASLKVPPAWVPPVLRLPDAVFFRLAGTMLKIDPEARSSMWEDLTRGRPTEIDALNGEIVRLAESVGKTAEVNKRVVALVRRAEAAKAGSPGLSAAALAEALGLGFGRV